MNLNHIANTLIPPPLNEKKLVYAAGETRDIIKEVLACYNDSKDQLKAFAPYLKGATVVETCKNIWTFWKENITYKVDPEGTQWIKTPAAVWSSKFCDCKSFSVAVAASLHALGITGKFRFTSYGGNTAIPTHVYVVAMHGGKQIIIDCVWTSFNSQKTFTKNWDYNMTTIYRIAGLNTTPRKGLLNIDVNDNTVTEGEMQVALDLQGLEMEQAIARRKHAVGSLVDNAYQTEIEAHKAALSYIAGKKSKAPKKAAAPKQSKKLAKATKANNGKKGVSKKQAKLLQKAGVTVKKRKEGILKKVGAGLKKALTAPARLAARTQLPKNAPFFLYTFITDPKVIAKLPETVRVKRDKALQYKNLMIKTLQMPVANFDKTIRNGIMNSFGKSPEDVIAQWMKESGFKIGLIQFLLKAGEGIKNVLQQAGEKLNENVEQFSPAIEDWTAGGLSPELKSELAKEVQNQHDNAPSVRVTPDGGYQYRTDKGYVPSDAENNGTGNYSNNGADSGTDEDSTNSEGAAKFTTLPGVEVDGGKVKKIVPEPTEDNGSGNGLLLLGVGVVAVLALSK